MPHYYYWRMEFRETGEILEGSRLYTDDRRANTYLYDYLYKHHAQIREDEAVCVELTVNRDDGTLLYSIIGDVYGARRNFVS